MATVSSTNYQSSLLQHRLLSVEEERAHLAAFQAGAIRSRDYLIRHNVRLVAKEAHKIARQFRGLDFDDLFQEGCIGLQEAIDRFDPGRMNRLSAYAYWWIKDAIQQYIRRNCTNQQELVSIDIVDPRGLPLDRLELLQTLSEQRRRIWLALADIPKVCRKIIVLRLLGRTWLELGDRFGFSASTVSNRFHEYFPAFLAALNTPEISPARRIVLRVVACRTPQSRLAKATHRPTRVLKVRQESEPSPSCDRTPRASWPRVISKVVRLPRPISQAAEQLKRTPLISPSSSGMRLFPLAVASAIRSLVGRLFGWSEPPVFQERLHTPAIVAPVSSSRPTVRGSPERSPPCSVAFINHK